MCCCAGHVGRDIDPLELHGDADAGVPGLLSAVRNGAVQVVNSPGAGLAEAPGITAWLPDSARRLFGEELRLPRCRTQWLGDSGRMRRGAWLARRVADPRRAGPGAAGEHVKPGDGRGGRGSAPNGSPRALGVRRHGAADAELSRRASATATRWSRAADCPAVPGVRRRTAGGRCPAAWHGS